LEGRIWKASHHIIQSNIIIAGATGHFRQKISSIEKEIKKRPKPSSYKQRSAAQDDLGGNK